MARETPKSKVSRPCKRIYPAIQRLTSYKGAESNELACQVRAWASECTALWTTALPVDDSHQFEPDSTLRSETRGLHLRRNIDDCGGWPAQVDSCGRRLVTDGISVAGRKRLDLSGAR